MKPFHYPHILRSLVVVALVAAGLASAAIVFAQSGDSNIINSCVNPHSGEIKIVGANQQCNPNQVALEWNQQGPAGPQGDPGPAGPQGPQGPAGPGAESYQIVVNPDGSTQFAHPGFTVSHAGTGEYIVSWAPGTFSGAAQCYVQGIGQNGTMTEQVGAGDGSGNFHVQFPADALFTALCVKVQ